MASSESQKELRVLKRLTKYLDTMNIHDASEFCDISYSQGKALLVKHGMIDKFDKLEAKKIPENKPTISSPTRYVMKTADDIAEDKAEAEIAKQIDDAVQGKPPHYVAIDLQLTLPELRRIASKFGVSLSPTRMHTKFNPLAWLKPSWRCITKATKKEIAILHDLEVGSIASVSKKHKVEIKEIKATLSTFGLTIETIRFQASKRYSYLAVYLEDNLKTKGLTSTARAFGFTTSQVKLILESSGRSDVIETRTRSKKREKLSDTVVSSIPKEGHETVDVLFVTPPDKTPKKNNKKKPQKSKKNTEKQYKDDEYIKNKVNHMSTTKSPDEISDHLGLPLSAINAHLAVGFERAN